MRTKLCELLDIEYPIICAPMGPDITGPELAAAVSNAGGLGIMQAQFAPPPVFRQQIQKLRDLTDKPFGVNLLLHFPVEEHVQICLEEKIPLLSFFWGDPSAYIKPAHDLGIIVSHQVGSVAAARKSAEAGTDFIIAQGVEAGGHIEGTVSTLNLLPSVLDVVGSTPVAAAGGIADSRGVAAALAMGAQAAVLGTRFLASDESHAHPDYKQKVVEAKAEDTVRTILFGHGWPNGPVRAINTPFIEEWTGNEQRGQESRPDEPVIGSTIIAGQEMPVLRFMGMPPNVDSKGDLELRSLLAGQTVSQINDIKPAAEIVKEIVSDLS
jgi:NAD(P)H-dependent flavin oxidoreductase YrpB (nitropropane dioxygenase family)